jgi:hypothetical protein
MSDIGEVVDPAFDEFVVEVPVTEEPTKQAEKPVKEKKLKVPKEKKPKQAKTIAHPPYFQVSKFSHFNFLD